MLSVVLLSRLKTMLKAYHRKMYAVSLKLLRARESQLGRAPTGSAEPPASAASAACTLAVRRVARRLQDVACVIGVLQVPYRASRTAASR